MTGPVPLHMVLIGVIATAALLAGMWITAERAIDAQNDEEDDQ